MNKFSIKEVKNGMYLTEEINGKYTFGKEEDRIIFYDEIEADIVLEYLNDMTEHCCVLLAEDTHTEFKVGDKVYASDWCYGEIIRIEDDIADIEFETAGGGGTVSFKLSELQHEED